MAQASVAANIHQSLDVHGNLPPEIAFDPHFFIDDVTQAIDLIVRQVPNPGVRIDSGSLEKLLTRVQSDTVDVRQCSFDSLVPGKINSRNSGHILSPLPCLPGDSLALPLLMPRIDANHPEHSVAPNDLAFLTAASH
jgi:hypothetical protein